MTAHAISIDQFHHPRLTNRLLVHLVGAQEEGVPIYVPPERGMRNTEAGKNLVIEFMLAQEQFMNAGEKGAGLSSLNDTVIISAADIYRFTDPQLGQDRRRHRLILGRVFN